MDFELNKDNFYIVKDLLIKGGEISSGSKREVNSNIKYLKQQISSNGKYIIDLPQPFIVMIDEQYKSDRHVGITVDEDNWDVVKPFIVSKNIDKYKEKLKKKGSFIISFPKEVADVVKKAIEENDKTSTKYFLDKDSKAKIIKEELPKWESAIENKEENAGLFPFWQYLTKDLDFDNVFNEISNTYKLDSVERNKLYRSIISYDTFTKFLSYIENVGNSLIGLKEYIIFETNDEILIKKDSSRFDYVFKNAGKDWTYKIAIIAMKENSEDKLSGICIWNGEHGYIEKWIGSSKKSSIKQLKVKWFHLIYDFYLKGLQVFDIEVDKYKEFLWWFGSIVGIELNKPDKEFVNGFNSREDYFYSLMNKAPNNKKFYIKNDKLYFNGKKLNEKESLYFYNLITRFTCNYSQFMEMAYGFKQVISKESGLVDVISTYPKDYAKKFKVEWDNYMWIKDNWIAFDSWCEYLGWDEYYPDSLMILSYMQKYAYLFGYRGTLVCDIIDVLRKITNEEKEDDGAYIAKQMKRNFDNKVYNGIEFAFSIGAYIADSQENELDTMSMYDMPNDRGIYLLSMPDWERVYKEYTWRKCGDEVNKAKRYQINQDIKENLY